MAATYLKNISFHRKVYVIGKTGLYSITDKFQFRDLVPDYYIDTLGDLFPHLQKYKSLSGK